MYQYHFLALLAVARSLAGDFQEANLDLLKSLISYHEVVHCDECHCIIKSTIYKCIDCFDYDLCPKCHSCKAINKNHHGGEHTFIAEKA